MTKLQQDIFTELYTIDSKRKLLQLWSSGWRHQQKNWSRKSSLIFSRQNSKCKKMRAGKRERGRESERARAAVEEAEVNRFLKWSARELEVVVAVSTEKGSSQESPHSLDQPPAFGAAMGVGSSTIGSHWLPPNQVGRVQEAFEPLENQRRSRLPLAAATAGPAHRVNSNLPPLSRGGFLSYYHFLSFHIGAQQRYCVPCMAPQKHQRHLWYFFNQPAICKLLAVHFFFFEMMLSWTDLSVSKKKEWDHLMIDTMLFISQ